VGPGDSDVVSDDEDDGNIDEDVSGETREVKEEEDTDENRGGKLVDDGALLNWLAAVPLMLGLSKADPTTRPRRIAPIMINTLPE
jgi:hypothetical protein